jgi:quercetin dioxygenase-like cupin family protein
MAIIRLYTGDDGETHVEQLDLTAHPELNELHGAKGVVFRTMPAGYFSDWHRAPRRQYVITLAGQGEVELIDGSRHRVGAGDVILAEDLTGRGHISRVVGDTPRVTATVHLA